MNCMTSELCPPPCPQKTPDSENSEKTCREWIRLFFTGKVQFIISCMSRQRRNRRKPKRFPFNSFDPATRERLRAIVTHAREVDLRLPSDLVALGRIMSEAKTIIAGISNGQFIQFINHVDRFEHRIISYARRVEKIFGELRIGTLSYFSSSALRFLSAPQVRQTARNAAILEAEGRSKVSLLRAKEIHKLFSESPKKRKHDKDLPEFRTDAHHAWENLEALMEGASYLNISKIDDGDGDRHYYGVCVRDDGSRERASRTAGTRFSLSDLIASLAGREKTKVCSGCGIARLLTQFTADTRTPDKLGYSCRQCEASRAQAAHAKKVQEQEPKEGD